MLILSLNLLMACQGMTNRSGAPTVSSSSMGATALSAATQCHYTVYQDSVAAAVASQCISCHANPGNGNLILQIGTSDSANIANFGQISRYISSSDGTSTSTDLIGRIAGGLTHPLKLTSGFNLTAFLTFTDGVVNDPSCTGADASGGTTSGDTGFAN